MSIYTGRRHENSFFDVDTNNSTNGSGAIERRLTSGQTPTYPLTINEEKRSVVPIFLHQKNTDTRGVELPLTIDNVGYVSLSRFFISGLTVPVNSIIVLSFSDVNRSFITPKTMNNFPNHTSSTLFAPSKDGMTIHELFQCPIVLQIHRSTRHLKGMKINLYDIDGNTLTYDHISFWGFAHTMDWDV